MSLTDQEKEVVLRTWSLATKDINAAGIKLFQFFFEMNPAYINLFPFKDIHNWEELKKDKRLKAHAANVMHTLNMLIDNLADTEVLIEMIEKLARSHYRRKISVEHFANLKKTVVRLLVDSLGDAIMNQEAIEAWSKTYDVILNVVRAQVETVE